MERASTEHEREFCSNLWPNRVKKTNEINKIYIKITAK